MEIDMHYYGIGFLARAAGFPKQQALTIAYASQYVDNATEGAPIHLKKNGGFFDPVRCAHYGLEAFGWDVHKNVYIPFHFIPELPFNPSSGAYNFVTEPNSPFANLLFKQASQKSPDETLRLIRMGIALHTLADSWAHRGFSGRKDAINNVKPNSIKVLEGKKMVKPVIGTLTGLADLEIGHAEAPGYPDQPFRVWHYVRANTEKTIERDNPTDYLNAAKTIHQLLRGVPKTQSGRSYSWKEIEEPIKGLFAIHEENTNRRCEKWRALYRKFFGDVSGYTYNKCQWRDEALKPKIKQDVDWDDFTRVKLEQLSFTGASDFYEKPWVKFHRAALQQRNFVLEHLM